MDGDRVSDQTLSSLITGPAPAAPPKAKASAILAKVRADYPAYQAVSDDALLAAVHKHDYPQMSPREFYGSLDFDNDRARLNPTDDMTGPQRFIAGMGKTPSDLIDSVKRVGNMVGIGNYDQAAAQEDQRIAQPLMATPGGKWGHVAGDVLATAIPMAKGGQVLTKTLAGAGRYLGAAGLAGAPTANAVASTATALAPYVAAAGTGAAAGAALSPDNMSGGAEMGAALGPLGEAGGRIAQGVIQGGKAVVEPLWDAGRQRVLRRTLDRFATSPSAVRAAAANPNNLVPGRTPTLAETSGDTGIAQLQRASQTMPPVATAMSDANSERMRAYKTALDDLAGNDGKRTFYTAEREGNAKQNYGAAYADGLTMTPDIQAQFDAVMPRPSIQDALPVAQRLARETNTPMTDAAGSVAGLHHIKLALDDQIGGLLKNDHSRMGAAVGDTQDALVKALREASPKYGTALDQYAADSRPINQMAIGQVLRDKMVPALGDYSDDLARSQAQQYATALRDSAGTASRATGRRGATIENTFDPAQLQTAENIAEDAARYAHSQEAGRIPGAPTAQYLGAQNILAQTLGPFGGASLVDSALGRTATGLLSLPFRATSSKTEEMLARALRDPAFAAQVLAAKDAAPLLARPMPTMQRAVVGANLDQNK